MNIYHRLMLVTLPFASVQICAAAEPTAPLEPAYAYHGAEPADLPAPESRQPAAAASSSLLPLLGDEARKRGYVLPLPFGVSINYMDMRQNINVDSRNFTGLSLDGRKEIHDRLRVDYAGNGSYERIVPKFQKLVEARGNKNYYMRGTFTHANPDFTKDLFHMADLGFTELSMEPVVCAPEDPAALTAEDLEIVKDQYELLAKDMLRREKEGKPITFYHYMLDLTGGPCIYKRISGCGSGTEYMAVTPWGDLYPCHQFVGEEAYKLGDIWNGVTNTALREEFRSCNAYARPECNDCWARFYCSGGCAANAFHATGSIRGVYEAGCELFRKRIECAIMMKVAEDSAKANG